MTPSSRLTRTHVLAIIGPTAVGKTAVAEDVALRRDGEIISADSMQVYRGMDIGTAKLPPSERKVPHWCVDLVEPGQPFSAALYQAEARAAIEDVSRRAKVPMVVGGSGLYVRAALDPLEFPGGEQTRNAVRAGYEAYAAQHGPEALYALLVKKDPKSAAVIHQNNTRRVLRALEMLDEGANYAEQRQGFSARDSIYDTTFIGLTMDRGALYKRIDLRVDAMIEAGLLDEVRALLDAGLRDALTARQAIGYKEFVPVVERGADLAEAVGAVKRASRRYAKRQLTWFRADPRVTWIDITDKSQAEATVAVLGALDW